MATKWVSLDKLRYAISKIHTLLQGKVDKVDGKGPVSYTHLDVYKRQVQY